MAAKKTIKKPSDKTVKNSASAGNRGAQPENAKKQTGFANKSGVRAVKLVKIKNKYMFTPTEQDKKNYKPDGVHTYIVFKDENGCTRAIRTTHLLEKKKQDQIEKNILMAMKLPGIKFPSGVRRGIISKDVEGNELDLKKVKAVNIRGKRGTYLSKKQTEKVVGFADKKSKKKKTP